MKTAIALQTKYGFYFYNAVFMDFNQYKTEGHLDEFKHYVYDERAKTEKELLKFLSDPVMMRKHKMDEEDVDGWKYYKETSDKYSTLNHFYNRK